MDAGGSPSLNFRDFLDALRRENEEELWSLAKKHGRFPYALLKNDAGSDALHVAASEGKTDACRFLLEVLNFDIDSINNDGNTPLFEASWNGHAPTIQYLIHKGADITISNYRGTNLLHCAARNGLAELMTYLLGENKLNPKSKSAVYGSPLLVSMDANSITCMEQLLQAGANPNECFYGHGTTPLGFAASELNIEMIRCLLRHDANPNVLDKTGTKAIEHAAKRNFREGVERLFPLTSRIEGYPHWSIQGIMRNVPSEEARELRKMMMDELFEQGKEEGNKALRSQNYEGAINWYTQAIEADPTSAALFCNRSLCWFRLNEGGASLDDAKACIKLRPHCLAKPYFREGKAWMALESYQQAVEAFSKAFALKPHNRQIQEHLQEAQRMAHLQEAQRKAQQAGQ